MEETLTAAVVFIGIYQIIKVFTDYLLKRKIIIAGHVDKAGILDMPKDKEENSYPTLKWGLVTLFGGLGLLVIALVESQSGLSMNWEDFRRPFLEIGIELISISLGFLLYFIIIRFGKK